MPHRTHITGHNTTNINTMAVLPVLDAPERLGFGRRWLRGISLALVVALANMTASPLAKALEIERNQQKATYQPAADERYAALLQQLKASVLTEQQTAYARAAAFGNTTQNTLTPETLNALRDEMHAEWAHLKTRWREAGVPESVFQQQTRIETEFDQKHNELLARLQSRTTLGGQAALAQFASQEIPEPSHHPIDLNNMPWQVLQNTAREPVETTEALNQIILPQTTPAQARTLVAPLQPYAAPTAAELAPTLDAPQTAEIKTLAAHLNNNPHTIYQWVHDNIHYFPTYGSVQGAQDTLDKKSGNAFDTASLLIALLRSANIPARYVYGTVDIPVENVMNWVGDAKTPSAASQILAQGGVPHTLVVSGGKEIAFRIEHVWVEAWIQYHPHRGAKHQGGTTQGDTWVPMDGSYKQYTYTPGMDLTQQVPFDAEALLKAAQTGATINETEGWVQGLNQAAAEQQLKAYQEQIKTYIENQNGGQSTVGDVLGTTRPIIDPMPYLAGTLPYTIRATAKRFDEIPNNLRHKFRYHIEATNALGMALDIPVLQFEAPTATLAGKKVTLTWVAADEANQKALEALIPTPAPGQELKPENLPRTLPAGIILKPQIRIEGELKAEGSGMSAGSESIGRGAFTRYGNPNNWDETTDGLIAGQQSTLGLSIQGVSKAQLDTLKNRMEKTKALLEQAQVLPPSQQATLLKDLTGEQLTGDMLTATLWGYFASLQSHGLMSGRQAGLHDAPGLSYGLFHAQVKPNKLYGIVTTGVSFQGLNMDIGHLRHIRWVKDDNPKSPINDKPELTQNGKSAAQNRWITYNKMRGQYSSAMEHSAPETFWVDKNTCRYTDVNGQLQNPLQAACPEAISAVKAISIAQQQGQKIYTINKSNRSTALPKLSIGGDVGAEIRNAINAGKEVTFHEKAISAHGWTGYGYIIIDPDTGAGAHMIEGKGNGGLLLILAGVAVIYLATLIGFTGIGMIIAAAAYVLGLALIAAGVALISGNAGLCKDILINASAIFLGVLAGVGAAALLEWGWALKLADQILLDLLIGFGVSVAVSQSDRAYPLFNICEAKE